MNRVPAIALAFCLTLSAVPIAGSLLEVPKAAQPLSPDPLLASIFRDDYGVAHIYADDEYAVWYANGYVQAQDRLWELDLLRHIGYGEAASVVGPSVLAMDLSVRRDLYSRAELQAQLDTSPAQFRALLQAYADGVNRAALELTLTGNIPAEFPALQHAFETWTPRDSAAVATFLLARFGTGGGEELDNARLLKQLEMQIGDPDQAWTALGDLTWTAPDPATAYATIPTGTYAHAAQLPLPKAGPNDLPASQLSALTAAKDSVPFGLDTTPAAVPLAAPPGAPVLDLDAFRLKWGSNALLVAPSLSDDGRALVGGGPQTGYFNPQILYEVGLHGAGLNITGVGVAGAPGVVLGRTANFAWTVTSGISDQADIVALPAAGAESYHWGPHQVRNLECRNEHHRVFGPPAATGGPPVIEAVDQDVCFARLSQGATTYPIVGITRDGAGAPTYFFALQSASRMREIDSAAHWLGLARATDLETFRAAFDDFAFTFNFIYAGRDALGLEVACYHHVGFQPKRHLNLDPRFPTPAGPAFRWHGFLSGVQDPGGELPHACNPAQGYFVNWNNWPQEGWTSGDARELWGGIHRVERLNKEVHDLIDTHQDANGNGLLTLADVKAILRHAATQDSLAGQIVPTILTLTPTGTAPGAVDALNSWAAVGYLWRSGGIVSNPRGVTYDDPGHTVYDALLPALLARVFGDEEGPFLREVHFNPQNSSDPHAGDHGQHNNMFAVLLDALAGTTARTWCDDVATAGVESCTDQVVAAFADAGLTGYAAAADVPLLPQHLSKFTSLGTGPAFTMPMTNRATYYHFHVGSDTATSVSIIAPGQSGHVNLAAEALLLAGGAPPIHMRDQLGKYIAFSFKPVPFTVAEATAASSAAPQTLVIPPP